MKCEECKNKNFCECCGKEIVPCRCICHTNTDVSITEWCCSCRKPSQYTGTYDFRPPITGDYKYYQ